MLSYLQHYEELFGPFRLFYFTTFRMMLAAAMAFTVGVVVGPMIIRELRAFKMAQVLRNAGEVGELAALHAKKKNTPTMGGLIIVCSVWSATFLCARPNVYVLSCLFVFTGLAIVGFLDDYLKIRQKASGGLPGRYKLIAQAVITLIAGAILLNHASASSFARELHVPFLKDPLIGVMPLWFFFAFLFLVLAGSSNAINLTDGIDGLAIGCTIPVALVYALMAYASGHAYFADYLLLTSIPGTGELAVVCAALLGASMAFLWFNAHPAEVFMGDTGSLALGGLIGMIAFIVHQPLTLIMVGGIFVMEALSVIIQVGSYKTRGVRVFRMAPIHHHFELMGWAETRVVIRFWILSLAFAIGGLATLKLR